MTICFNSTSEGELQKAINPTVSTNYTNNTRANTPGRGYEMFINSAWCHLAGSWHSIKHSFKSVPPQTTRVSIPPDSSVELSDDEGIAAPPAKRQQRSAKVSAKPSFHSKLPPTPAAPKSQVQARRTSRLGKPSVNLRAKAAAKAAKSRLGSGAIPQLTVQNSSSPPHGWSPPSGGGTGSTKTRPTNGGFGGD
ncbi:hypothetical protein ON010_g17563 [Phytophthora cinnamomi]|nr:hypothetical protein ON010_g17563 [Phytophthora cinnamomi]